MNKNSLFDDIKEKIESSDINQLEHKINELLRISEAKYKNLPNNDTFNEVLNVYYLQAKYFEQVAIFLHNDCLFIDSLRVYEKIIYLCESVLRNNLFEQTEVLNGLTESYMQIIYRALYQNITDNISIDTSFKCLYKYAKNLYKHTSNYTYQSALIVYYDMHSDYYNNKKLILKSYFSLKKAIKLLSIVYNTYPKIEIYNDLIHMIEKMIAYCNHHNYKRLTIKWNNKLKEVKNK